MQLYAQVHTDLTKQPLPQRIEQGFQLHCPYKVMQQLTCSVQNWNVICRKLMLTPHPNQEGATSPEMQDESQSNLLYKLCTNNTKFKYEFKIHFNLKCNALQMI